MVKQSMRYNGTNGLYTVSSNGTKLQRKLRNAYNHNLIYKGFDNANDVAGAFNIAGKRISYEKRFNELKDYLSTKNLTQKDKSVIISEILNPVSSYVGINAGKLKNIDKVYGSVADIYENLNLGQEVITNTEKPSILEFKTRNSFFNKVKKAAALTLVTGSLVLGGYLTGCGNEANKELKSSEKKEQVSRSSYSDLRADLDKSINNEFSKLITQIENNSERIADLEEMLNSTGRPDGEVIAETTVKITKALESKHNQLMKQEEEAHCLALQKIKEENENNLKKITGQYQNNLQEVEKKYNSLKVEAKSEVKSIENKFNKFAKASLDSSFNQLDSKWKTNPIKNIKSKYSKINLANINISNKVAASNKSSLETIEEIAKRVNAKYDKDHNIQSNESDIFTDSYNGIVKFIKDASDPNLNGTKEILNFSVNLTEKSKEYTISAANYTEKDLGIYVNHVIARNPQSDGKNISISLNNLKNHALDNFKPLAEEFTTASDLGYDLKNISKRGDNVIDGLKKSGNGLMKFVSGGFVDFDSDQVKEKEGWQGLRLLKGTYDVPFGLVSSAVNLVDIPAAGVVGKTVNVVDKTVTAAVNYGLDDVNYLLALPMKGSQELENLSFKNNGKVSQTTYDLLCTVARFGGNVVLHETPRNGKTIRIVDKQGNYQDISKGEIGATLEMLTCLGLDTSAIVGLSCSAGGNGNSGVFGGSHNGGGYNGPGGGGGGL